MGKKTKNAFQDRIDQKLRDSTGSSWYPFIYFGVKKTPHEALADNL